MPHRISKRSDYRSKSILIRFVRSLLYSEHPDSRPIHNPLDPSWMKSSSTLFLHQRFLKLLGCTVLFSTYINNRRKTIILLFVSFSWKCIKLKFVSEEINKYNIFLWNETFHIKCSLIERYIWVYCEKNFSFSSTIWSEWN